MSKKPSVAEEQFDTYGVFLARAGVLEVAMTVAIDFGDGCLPKRTAFAAMKTLGLSDHPEVIKASLSDKPKHLFAAVKTIHTAHIEANRHIQNHTRNAWEALHNAEPIGRSTT